MKKQVYFFILFSNIVLLIVYIYLYNSSIERISEQIENESVIVQEKVNVLADDFSEKFNSFKNEDEEEKLRNIINEELTKAMNISENTSYGDMLINEYEYEIDDFTDVEQVMLVKWNRLTRVNSLLEVSGYHLGDSISEIIAKTNSQYSMEYYKLEENAGEEGVLVKVLGCDLYFIGDRINRIEVTDTKSVFGDIKEKESILEILKNEFSEEIYTYNLSENEYNIIDEKNNTQLNYYFLDNELYYVLLEYKEFIYE